MKQWSLHWEECTEWPFVVFFKKKKTFILFIYFWLLGSWVAALGGAPWAPLSCSAGPCCSLICGIFLPRPGSDPRPLELEGRL